MPLPSDVRLARLAEGLMRAPASDARLKDWADAAAMSERTLIRKLQKETGLSFREFRRQVRVIASLELLSRGEAVTTTALDVGFESPSAFIQAFCHVTGTTPGRYVAGLRARGA